jgi:hypothetical protein|tara:strand:+ start:67 stop:219 length:153 start_codon:yes stop_codon:yes gene_type:complete
MYFGGKAQLGHFMGANSFGAVSALRTHLRLVWSEAENQSGNMRLLCAALV